MLNVLFIGASTVNFGGAPGPWDHSRRLEKLGGVKVVGIADPDVGRAQDILKLKLQGPHALMYEGCQVFSTYQDAILNTTTHLAFIGMTDHNVLLSLIALNYPGIRTFVLEIFVAHNPAHNSDWHVSAVSGCKNSASYLSPIFHHA
jgi:hypothetical protein